VNASLLLGFGAVANANYAVDVSATAIEKSRMPDEINGTHPQFRSESSGDKASEIAGGWSANRKEHDEAGCRALSGN
jgi:hypothetical protein